MNQTSPRGRKLIEDCTRRIESNVDVDFFLLAAALDPRWKDLKMIRKPEKTEPLKESRRRWRL